jgi:glycosyltransferase involved in cell wall biosynthesis
VDLGAHFGGVENYLTNLASLVGGEVEIYALCVLPELGSRLASSGVEVIRLPTFAGILKPFRFLAALFVLPIILLFHRIDVVQLNGLLESILIYPTRMLARAVVYTRHGPFEVEDYVWWRQPLKFLPRKLAQLNVRFATHVVCVSEAVATSVQAIIPAARYSVIPNWVLGHSRAIIPRNDLLPEVKVLCASRLERYKGIHLLIAAAKEWPHLQVTIAGEGSYRAPLEELARGMTNVHFAGFQRDLQKLYESADIFVMPSMGPEGLPMTSLEAMAHGLPCIFSDLPVHNEITDGGKGACLFRSGDAKSLSDALSALSRDSAMRRKFAAEAFRIISERYTDDSVRAAYLRVLSG